MNSKGLMSRWKYIFVVDDQKNDTTCFELNELGKIKKATLQPRKISMRKKFITLNKGIKELVSKIQHSAKKPVLSFSGNIEIFSKEKDNEFKMININDNKTKKEKSDENVEIGINSPNTEKNYYNLFNYFNFDDDMLQNSIEFDDFPQF